MRKQLAIKGHEYRGNEVIEVLKMLGASNKKDYTGNYPTTLYILDGNNIDLAYTCDCDNQEIFKLEDFLRKYPFKIGDKVINDDYSGYGIITEMVWDSVDWCVKYCVKFEDFGTIAWFNSYEIKISDVCQRTDDRNVNDICEDILIDQISAKVAIINLKSDVCDDEVELILNDYEIEVRDGKTYAILKKPKYPKTFIEVLNFWHPDRQIEDDYQRYYKKDLIEKFQNLLYARDAYWKIAGEEMGLGKSWEPDWTDNSQKKFTISYYQGKINLTGGHNVHRVLAFPTKEMRDVFYTNFKDLRNKSVVWNCF